MVSRLNLENLNARKGMEALLFEDSVGVLWAHQNSGIMDYHSLSALKVIYLEKADLG